MGDSCIRILSSVPTGRNSGPWSQATVQAMGYPTHENALHRSLTRYIPHRSVGTEQVVKWHDICLSRRADCPTPTIVGQRCVLKCVSRLCTTLYNCMIKVTLTKSELIHKTVHTACPSCGQLSVHSHATDDVWTQQLLLVTMAHSAFNVKTCEVQTPS